MKSPKQPFRPELLRTMQAAREALARTMFDPVTVKSALSQAAGAGQAYCVLAAPLDLRETVAGQQIVAWCTAEGLRWDWSRRAPLEAHADAAFDLVVNWKSEA